MSPVIGFFCRFRRRGDPFPDVVRALAKRRVAYVFVGGYAVYLYGARDPASVGDVDILIRNDQDNLGRLRGALADLGAEGQETPEGFWRNESRFGQLDVHRQVWLKGIGRADYGRLRRHASRRRVAGHRAWVPSLDDVIAMKQTGGRSRDRRDVEELTRVKEQQG